MASKHKSNGHGAMRAAERREAELRAANSILLERMNFMRMAGVTFNLKRDTYAVLGYPRELTVLDYYERYCRGGIAGRVVDALPKATWRSDVWLEENDNPDKLTTLEQQWEDLVDQFDLQTLFLRVDILSQLSSYAVLLIGAPGDLSSELPRGKPGKLTTLSPFLGGGGPGVGRDRGRTVNNLDGDVSIQEFETDHESPRFGLPKTYQIRRLDASDPAFQRPVHWSRIIHVAEGCLDNEVYGQPALERVWNLLDDLDKITGGGAEAAWLNANRGLHLNVDKDIKDMSPEERAALQTQADEYQHQIRRMIRTRGVEVQSLGSDVSQFGPNADAILTQIAGAKAIPKRILTGSEMGELASSQDRENWRDQVVGRQEGYAGPSIVRRLVKRLMDYGYLAASKKFEVRWNPINTRTEDEKAQGALRWTSTNKAQGEIVFTNDEIRDYWYGKKPLTDEEKVPPQPPAAPQAEVPEDEEDVVKKDLKVAQTIQQNSLVKQEPAEFSSTQVQLPDALRGPLWNILIPYEELCQKEGGREMDSHVTVKYGLHTSDPEDVRPLVAGIGSIDVTLGALDIFEAEDYDVLYAKVQSPQLVELNKRLSANLEVTDTHPTYKPHATVAYLHKGFGGKYKGRTDVAGLRATIDTLVFCAKDRTRTAINLTEEKLVATLERAIRTGDARTVMEVVGLGEGNPYHDEQGRFTTGPGGGEGSEADVPRADVPSAPRPELEARYSQLPDRTVVATSKYGEVKTVKDDRETRYVGYRRSGEGVGTFKRLSSAMDALREPVNREMFRSGYLRPDVKWKFLDEKGKLKALLAYDLGKDRGGPESQHPSMPLPDKADGGSAIYEGLRDGVPVKGRVTRKSDGTYCWRSEDFKGYFERATALDMRQTLSDLGARYVRWEEETTQS